MSRKTAIKAKCLECSDGYKDREACDDEDCPLFPYRLGVCEKGKSTERNMGIKRFCSWCACGERQEVINCPCEDCPLYPYRAYTNN